MRAIRRFACLHVSLVVVLLAVTVAGRAQGRAAATQELQLSAFGAATGTFTDVGNGKNLAITAGVDLTYLPLRLIRPSIEVRGTYPVAKGNLDSQKSLLVGIKGEHVFGRIRPYADFLVGRGEVDYLWSGFNPYLSTTSTVYSFGGGVDYKMSHHFAVKADIQSQRWVAVMPLTLDIGAIHPTAVSAGLVYHFDFNRRRRYHDR